MEPCIAASAGLSYFTWMYPRLKRSYTAPKAVLAQVRYLSRRSNPFSQVKSTALVFFKILETGQTIPLEDGEEFTLGRISGSQPILPDIDLTPYKAYEGGVSRLHATIKIDHDQVTITDLGSANGTRINSKKIAAHQAYPLSNEDILSLGKFKAQILIQ